MPITEVLTGSPGQILTFTLRDPASLSALTPLLGSLPTGLGLELSALALQPLGLWHQWTLTPGGPGSPPTRAGKIGYIWDDFSGSTSGDIKDLASMRRQSRD